MAVGLLNSMKHWQERAEGARALAPPRAEARLLAAQLEDPEAKAATLKIADEYERLALRAAKRMEDMASGDSAH